MNLTLPDFCLLLIEGATRDVAAAVAARHFAVGEVLLPSTPDGLMNRVSRRLSAREFAVVDITGLSTEERRGLGRISRELFTKSVVLAVDAPGTPMREDAMRRLDNDGFRTVHHLTAEQVSALCLTREPLKCDRRAEAGPFDIIGDVHGCCDEVELLLGRLGYVRGREGAFAHPAGRRALFLGDLCDRGPRIVDVYRTVMAMVEHGSAICLAGNHDEKLAQFLSGKRTRVTKGVAMTIAELDALGDEAPAMKERIVNFVAGLSSHYTLDGGKLVVAHGGLIESMHNRHTGETRAFAIYGDTTGEIDKDGFPVRRDWAINYTGKPIVVYGHTVVTKIEWVNRTLDIDTGCVFGGYLTALRYPEMEIVQQRAVKQHYHGRSII